MKIKPSHKTLITGDNGRGKTNILDAVYHVLNPREKCSPERNISFGEGVARMSLELSKNGSGVLVEVLLDEKKKTYRENKKATQVKSASLNAVYFKPEDLKITSGPPSERRKFINEVGCQLEAGYCKNVQDYTKALRSKNRLLKTGAPQNQIEPWNNKMAELGAQIYKERKKTITLMREIAHKYFSEFNEGELHIEYLSQAEGEEPEKRLLELMEQRGCEETSRKASIVGTHLDDIKISTAGIELTRYGSHGQQRTVAFILRMAQAKLLEDRWKTVPVILMDDLKSELDSKHKEIAEKILSGPHQVITTSTDACFDEKEFKIIEI